MINSGAINNSATIDALNDVNTALTNSINNVNTALTNSINNVNTTLTNSINTKQATITGGASSVTSTNLTANRALISNGSGKIAVSSVSSTELGYLDGVTSAIQTQLNSKITTAITKASNGSWKDNNSGLIINWGRFKSPSKQTTFQVSFNRAFTSTNYSVCIIDSSGSINSDEYVNSISVTPASTTYFNCIQRLTDLPDYNWIAIGY